MHLAPQAGSKAEKRPRSKSLIKGAADILVAAYRTLQHGSSWELNDQPWGRDWPNSGIVALPVFDSRARALPYKYTPALAF